MNLCLAINFLSLRIGNNCLELNTVNILCVVAIWRVDHEVCSNNRRGMCVCIVLVEKQFFLNQMWIFGINSILQLLHQCRIVLYIDFFFLLQVVYDEDYTISIPKTAAHFFPIENNGEGLYKVESHPFFMFVGVKLL